MKILITTDLYSVKTNGVVTSVRHLCDELKERGHEIRILTLSHNRKSYSDEGVYYICSTPTGVYPGTRMPLSYRHKLIKELIEWKPDIIHSQCEIFTMQFAMRVSKLTGAPIVHTYHTMYEDYIGYVLPGKKLGKRVVRYLTNKRLKKVKLVVAPTEKTKNVLEIYGLDKEICVIPTGIDLKQHRNRLSSEQRSEKRREFGIEDDDFVLVSLGRLGTEKNVAELVNYFSEMAKQNEKIFLMIVGDGPEKENLQKQAAELGVADRVIFTGMVSPTEVQSFYQMGDIFVSASTSETQGLTYIEAAANGLPLVCRKDPCLEPVVEQGVNGYAYTNGDEFREAVLMAQEHPEWREKASEYSRKKADAFSKESFGAAAEAVYLDVLNCQRQSAENVR